MELYFRATGEPDSLTAMINKIPTEYGVEVLVTENPQTYKARTYEDKQLYINFDSHTISKNNESFGTTPHEFRMIAKLVDPPNVTRSRKELYEAAAQQEWMPGNRSVDVFVSKLKARGLEGLVCVPNEGYKYVPSTTSE